MKKFCIVFLTLAIIILSGIGLSLPESKTETEYLRIHIRANSNTTVDQSVKYKVKEKVVEFLTPFIAVCDTKVKAEKMLYDNLENISRVATNTLKENGFNYLATAKVKNEKFPTRGYGRLTLESGFYDALIINLGSGEGDNWWCVVYPPLCFTGEGVRYEYRSKIKDVINDFFKKEKS